MNLVSAQKRRHRATMSFFITAYSPNRPVFLPGRDVPLALVVVKGFGDEPLMLLTNLPIKKTRKSLWWAVEAYITRWKIEETIRFIKQCYQLEDIRLLTYIRLQNMMALVMAVAFFTMAYLGLRQNSAF